MAKIDPEMRKEIEILHNKRDKTVDEWVELCTNPHYYNNGIRGRTRRRTLDSLFCSWGSGIVWNDQGFINDENGWWKYESSEELKEENEKIKKFIDEVLEEEFSKREIDHEYEAKRLSKIKEIKNLQKKDVWNWETIDLSEWYIINPHSRLLDMPVNAHKSYIDAGLEIAQEALTYPLDSKYFEMRCPRHEDKRDYFYSRELAKFIIEWVGKHGRK